MRTCAGAALNMSKNDRQSVSRRSPAATCLIPFAGPGARQPVGTTSVSTVWGKSMAALSGSPGRCITNPRGARRNAVWRSSVVNDS